MSLKPDGGTIEKMNLSRRLFLIRSAAFASTVYATPSFKKYPFTLVLLGHKTTFWCRIVLWEHASPRQAHKRSASRHI